MGTSQAYRKKNKDEVIDRRILDHPEPYPKEELRVTNKVKLENKCIIILSCDNRLITIHIT